MSPFKYVQLHFAGPTDCRQMPLPVAPLAQTTLRQKGARRLTKSVPCVSKSAKESLLHAALSFASLPSPPNPCPDPLALTLNPPCACQRLHVRHQL